MTLISLQGHVSQETAYTQPDYPYGRTLRCQRRVWVETAAKGSKKGQMRFVYQTSNPKNGGWNTPTNGQYSDYILLVHNTENDHVDPVHLSISTWGEAIARFNQFHTDFYQQLNDENRKAVDHVGFCCAALKNTEKGLFVNAVEAHQGDRIEVDDRWFYDKDLGLVQDVFAHKVGDGDSATIPVVSAQEWHPKKGFLFNLHSRISEEMEAKARAIVEWKPADFPKELWCRTVLYGWRGFVMPDGKPVNDLAIAWKNEKDKTKQEELRTQIWNAAEAYHDLQASESVQSNVLPFKGPKDRREGLWNQIQMIVNCAANGDLNEVDYKLDDLIDDLSSLAKNPIHSVTVEEVEAAKCEAIAVRDRENSDNVQAIIDSLCLMRDVFLDEPANDSVEQFNPEGHIKLVADDIQQLRRSDLYRLLNDIELDNRGKMVDFILAHREDLQEDVGETILAITQDEAIEQSEIPPTELELNGCIYWNTVTPFPSEFQAYLDKILQQPDEWMLVNAPRPIPGDFLFQGDFKHGIFYAYGVASNFFQAWKNLDAWRVKPITNREIIKDLERRSQKYSRTLSEMTSKLSKERLRNWVIDMASQYGMPFADRPEPGYLDLVEAVNNGKNTISDLIAHFYGKETYDYTEYATSPEEIINRRVQIDLIGGCPAYIYDGDKIILKPEEEDLKKIADILPEATEAIAPIDEFDIDIEEEESSEELDASLVAAWDSADDSEESEPEAVEVDEAIAQYLNVVAMAADNTHALTAKKAEQCLDYCLDNGIAGFKEWLLQQDIKPAVKTAVENWEEKPVDPFEVEVVDTPSAPKSLKTSKTKSKAGSKSKGDQRKKATEESDRQKAIEVAKTLPNLGKSLDEEGDRPASKAKPKVEPVPAKQESEVEPTYWRLVKSPSQEDLDIVLGILAELGEDELISRIYEPVAPKGKKLKGDEKPVRRGTSRVPEVSAKDQKSANQQAYKDYGAIMDLIGAIGPTKAAAQLTAQGRKMGPTTASQIKIAWGYLHTSTWLKQLFDGGYISWSHIYSGRGAVEEVEQKIKAQLEKKGTIPF